MSNDFIIQGEPRDSFGKSLSRKLRREGRVPAVVYGAGKEPASISLDHKEISNALNNEAFYSHILTLKISGKKAGEKIVLKDLQRHPYKTSIIHVDFLRVSAKEKLTMKVPLHFLNEEVAPGVKEEGGVVNKLSTEVEVSCLPADLPEFIEVDIAELKLNETLHLSNITLPEGVELVALSHEDDQAIISIHIPKEISEEEITEGEEGEVEAAAEGEESGDAGADAEASADNAEGEDKKEGE